MGKERSPEGTRQDCNRWSQNRLSSCTDILEAGGLVPAGVPHTAWKGQWDSQGQAQVLRIHPRRRQLAKLALIFSYMHAELAALFPGGRYCGHKYQLTEVSAHTFWRERCGAR